MSDRRYFSRLPRVGAVAKTHSLSRIIWTLKPKYFERLMNCSRFQYIYFIAGFALLGVSVSCAPSIAPYSETAYNQAVGLKVESLRLMSRAEQPFETYSKRIEDLEVELDKAYEFAKGRPKNVYSSRQWEILLDPEKNLLGGFLRHWEGSHSLSWPFIEEARGVVAEAFDTIIGLESGKVTSAERL